MPRSFLVRMKTPTDSFDDFTESVTKERVKVVPEISLRHETQSIQRQQTNLHSCADIKMISYNSSQSNSTKMMTSYENSQSDRTLVMKTQDDDQSATSTSHHHLGSNIVMPVPQYHMAYYPGWFQHKWISLNNNNWCYPVYVPQINDNWRFPVSMKELSPVKRTAGTRHSERIQPLNVTPRAHFNNKFLHEKVATNQKQNAGKKLNELLMEMHETSLSMQTNAENRTTENDKTSVASRQSVSYSFANSQGHSSSNIIDKQEKFKEKGWIDDGNKNRSSNDIEVHNHLLAKDFENKNSDNTESLKSSLTESKFHNSVHSTTAPTAGRSTDMDKTRPSSADKIHVCKQCNKSFNRASNLRAHMKRHSQDKPYQCDYCGKVFHQKIDKRIHHYTHTGEKPHKCMKCGRGFKQLTHLNYHMRTHSDTHMYRCTYCDKGFNQKGNLQAHIYGHTGQRPFKCEVCGKGFTLRSTLNTHLRTHAPKKPFVCEYCNKAFYQKNALKMHHIASHPIVNGKSIL